MNTHFRKWLQRQQYTLATAVSVRCDWCNSHWFVWEMQLVGDNLYCPPCSKKMGSYKNQGKISVFLYTLFAVGVACLLLLLRFCARLMKAYAEITEYMYG